MKEAFKVIFVIYTIIATVFTVWFLASWADVVLNPLRQPWNFFDVVLNFFK